MRGNKRIFIAALALATALPLAGVALPGAVPGSASTNGTVLNAITEAKETAKLNFYAPGLIKEVSVKEGDLIKKDQVLVLQDDDLQKDQVAIAEAEAVDPSRLEYYVAAKNSKDKNFQKIKDANDSEAKNALGSGKAASPPYSANEYDAAELDAVQATKQVAVGKVEQKGNQLKYEQEQTKLTKMQLLSPIDGIVQRILIHKGEMAAADPDKPVLIVVQNDPCDVTITGLKFWQVSRLKPGDMLEVRYTDETQWRQAKIWFIDPVAQNRGIQQIVKAEMPNPEKRSTGLPVEIKVPARLLENPPAGGFDMVPALP